MSQLPDLEAWAIFAKVAERGSFSDAARELGLAKTTVSKSVSRLEERMRTTLFHRTTRKLSLTETGRLSLERAMRILADGTAIEADVLEEAAVPRGLVRASVLTAFGEDALAPVLPDFLIEYPEIELDIVLTDRPVDIVAEGFDLAVRIGAGADSSLRASRLSSLRRPLTAAPALLERHGVPAHPEDLREIPALISSHVPRPTELLFHGPDAETCLIQLRQGLRVNSSRALVPALLAGFGDRIGPRGVRAPCPRDGRARRASSGLGARRRPAVRGDAARPSETRAGAGVHRVPAPELRGRAYRGCRTLERQRVSRRWCAPRRRLAARANSG